MLSPILDFPVGLTVDPLLLAASGSPLMQAAAALRQTLRGLDGAWLAAADVLNGQRSGQALQVCRAGMQRGLAACVAELDAFSEAFQASATVYADADGTAVSGSAH